MIPRRMVLCRGRDMAQCLGSFMVGELAMGHGRFTEDRHGLYIPELWLEPCVIKALVGGRPIFQSLLGCTLLERKDDKARWYHTPWTFVWGDLRFWECGDPMVRRVLLLRGIHEQPDLRRVMRYLGEMPKPS
jgi:hypothetical protein